MWAWWWRFGVVEVVVGARVGPGGAVGRGWAWSGRRSMDGVVVLLNTRQRVTVFYMVQLGALLYDLHLVAIIS